MILETIFTLMAGVIAMIVLVILIGVLFIVYIAVSSVLLNLTWLIRFYKKYQPNMIDLEKSWLVYLKKQKKNLKKDIKNHELEALSPKAWNKKNN